jgi:hypothetical protein
METRRAHYTSYCGVFVNRALWITIIYPDTLAWCNRVLLYKFIEGSLQFPTPATFVTYNNFFNAMLVYNFRHQFNKLVVLGLQGDQALFISINDSAPLAEIRSKDSLVYWCIPLYSILTPPLRHNIKTTSSM